MPVHNALPHLDEAVRSILDQTYRNFEFVIFDDGSTDGSLQRLRYWAAKDPRIRLIESKTNLGPVGSSNRVAEAARTNLVARMDADDVSHPERLERQVAVMRERPDVALVASTCDIIGPNGERIRRADTWRLTRTSWFAPFAHGSILYRHDIFERVGGYRAECEFWEDQDLFVRMLAFTDKSIVVLRDPLFSNRHSPISTRVSVSPERLEQAVDLAYRCIHRLNCRQWYDDLLGHQAATPKVDPRVFISHGSLRLWANERPRELDGLLKRGRLALDFGTMSALVWTLWASASPGSLRGFMRSLAAVRNRTARGNLPDAIEWAPPHRAEVSRSVQAAAANASF